MLPMGTTMTSSMVIGLLFSSRLPVLNSFNKLPVTVRKSARAIVFLAGCWNVFWYGVQHPTEFWGVAALVSGSLMLVTSFYIYGESRLPSVLRRLRPVVQVALLACVLLYGVTIYHL